jgi:2-polyprenyl-3-methyl-5-hydroxy-6-metoxy-1,4-benzoquinol methylase
MNCGICGTDKVENTFAVNDYSITKETFNIGTCSNCGLAYTYDAPSEQDCARYYQSEDYISHSNTNKGLIFSVYHRVRSYMIGRKASLVSRYHASGSLLDMGCGTGYFAGHMQSLGYQVTGIEIDDNARQYGIDHFGIKATTPDVLKSGELAQTYKVITMWHVLEHLYLPLDFLNIFAAILDTDGVLIIAVPNHKSKDAKMFDRYWAAYDVPRHLWHFDPTSMAKLANAAGFEIVLKEHMPFDPFYNSLLSARYQGRLLAPLVGFWVGFSAYILGLRDVNKASSVIYVLRKSKL